MQTPDRCILRRIKEYDPALYVSWNYRCGWFDLYRKNENGKTVLVTPIVESIYDRTKPRGFCALDERILWWLGECDVWKAGDIQRELREQDSRWLDFHEKLNRAHLDDFRNRAKDSWRAINNFHFKRHAPKNGPPRFSNHKIENKWVRPDVGARTSGRLFSRSKANALLYDYKRGV